MLGDRGDPRGQTARQPNQHVLDGRGAFVLGSKHLGMVGVELESGLATLFFAQAEKAFDR